MGATSARPARGSIALPLLVGWWFGAWAASFVEARGLGRLDGGASPRIEAFAGVPPLAHPRALRAARGVGRRRSVDLARFLWEEGSEAPIETLRGFGPATAAAARAALADLARSR